MPKSEVTNPIRFAAPSGDRSGRRAPSHPGRLRVWLRRLRHGFFFCLGVFIIVSVVLIALYRDVAPPATPLMLLRYAQGYGISKTWRPLGQISPFLIKAVIAGEDAKFCRHRGFDWDAIDAAWDRYQSGRGRMLGASTISMQTAKNLYLWPGRDWLRKGLEAYFTTLMELSWSKSRILELYLNIVEWGPGIYGAQEASERYFRKSADRLSPYEAVRLAAVLPDPLDRSARAPGRDTSAHAAFILRQMPDLPVWQPLPCGEPH